MVVIHSRSKRKPTGGRYTSWMTKRVHMRGSKATHTHIGEAHAKTTRTKGGALKTRLLKANKVNVYDPKSKKHSIETIKQSTENPADRHFVRHSIITKGAVIVTTKGKARITSRPGQDSQVNAVLIE